MSLYDRVVGEEHLAEMSLRKLKRIGFERRTGAQRAQMQHKVGRGNFRYSQTHEAPRGSSEHAAGAARVSAHKAARGVRKTRGA